MKKVIITVFALLMPLVSFASGGYYEGGEGSSHKGGHYKNAETNDHYQKHDSGAY